jgi:hypothetical protein
VWEIGAEASLLIFKAVIEGALGLKNTFVLA